MLFFQLLVCLQTLIAVQGFKVSSRIDVKPESESLVSSSLRMHQRSLDPPYPDHAVYDAVFVGEKKPLTIDCTQPGIICKFPVVVTEKEGSSKPIKQTKEVPIIKGVDVKAEGRDQEDKEEILLKPAVEDSALPIFKGSVDIESLVADDKDIEETWILEKNILNKKYQIPVKLVPSKRPTHHGIAPIYPTHHDFHDHFSGGDSYHFPSHTSGNGWTPWMRAYPSGYNYHSQPCQPPVYHQPPPCSPVAPTRKPTINIDDKIDKEED